MEGENLTPRALSSKDETGVLGFALGQVTYSLGMHAGPSSDGDQTLPGHQLQATSWTPSGCILEQGVQHYGSLCSPQSAAAAPRACSLLPPGATSPQLLESWDVEIWDAADVEDGDTLSIKAPVRSPFSTPMVPSSPMSTSLHLDLQTSQCPLLPTGSKAGLQIFPNLMDTTKGYLR